MSEMRPLLDESLPADAAALLRSASTDAALASDASRARVAAAMEASPDVQVVVSAAKTAGLPSLALGLVGLALIVGAASFVATKRTESSPPQVATKTVDSTAPVTRPESRPEAVPTISPLPSLRVEDLPTAAVPREAPPAPRTTTDELAIIDAARAALNGGRADEALRRVETYRALGRAKTYVVEADVIEIEALVGLGRSNEARARAERFLAAHPRSPYEQRIQRLLREVP